MSALLTEIGGAEQTLRRPQGGDGDAFATLTTDHESMVFSIAWHFFGDRNRGEEIAQDVFLQLYRNLAKIVSRAHLVFWLRQVTSRRCIDEVRRAGPRRVSLDDAPDFPIAPITADPLASRRLQEMVAALRAQDLEVAYGYLARLGSRDSRPVFSISPKRWKRPILYADGQQVLTVRKIGAPI